MPVLAYNLAALTIAALYYTWRDGYCAYLRRERVLRERVTYLLWTAAQHVA
jgi:hypothetical protein